MGLTGTQLVQRNHVAAGAPDKGAAIGPILFDFTQSQSFNFQYGLEQGLGAFGGAQTAFIDNSLSPGTLTIQWANSNQKILVAPFSQIYIPIISPTPIGFTITTSVLSNSAAGNASIYILNYATSAQTFSPKGFLVSVTGPGDVVIPSFAGQTKFMGGFSAVGPTATAPIGPPFFFITAITCSIRGGTTQAVDGNLRIQIRESLGINPTIMEWAVYVPAVAAVGPASALVLTTPPGFLYISAVNGSTPTITLSSALLTGGAVFVFTCGATNTQGVII